MNATQRRSWVNAANSQLRSASSDDFPDASRFVQLHSAGKLTSAQDAAERVLAWLERADFGAQVVADVRNP